MNYFFITGLPRSMTGWLSVLFTQGRAVCLHDVMRVVNCAEDFRSLAEHFSGGGEVEFFGASCSGIPLWLPEVREDFPGARLAVVRRPLKEVKRSARRLELISRGGAEAMAAADEQIDGLKRGLDGFVTGNVPVCEVEFSALRNDMNSVRMMWEYLLPGGPEFNGMRWRFLRGMKVDLAMDGYSELVREEMVTKNFFGVPRGTIGMEVAQ